MSNDDGSIVVLVERPNTSVRLGLAIDNGTGIPSGVIPGSAFDTSTKDDPNIQAKVLNKMVLYSVCGTVMTWGSPASLQMVASILGYKTSFELRFIPSTKSKTEIAVLLTRADPTASLGISIDPESGRVLGIADGGPAAAGIKANYELESIAIILQKYMLVAVDGVRIDWASNPSIGASVAGKKQVVFFFDEHPDFRTPDSEPLIKTMTVPKLVAAPPQVQPPTSTIGVPLACHPEGPPPSAAAASAPPTSQLPTCSAAPSQPPTVPAPPLTIPAPTEQPLYIRCPELYRSSAGLTCISEGSPEGSRYVARTLDGVVIASVVEKRQATMVNKSHNGPMERITRTFTDGTTEIVEVVNGQVVANTVGCPHTQEIFNQNKIDSCFGRFPLVTATVFKKLSRPLPGINAEKRTETYDACVVCSLEQKYHISDGSCVERPVDAYTPKSHMSCTMNQGMLEKYTKIVPPMDFFCRNRHPVTNDLLCKTCKFPIHEHPPGESGPDALMFLASRPPPGWLPEHGSDVNIALRAASALTPVSVQNAAPATQRQVVPQTAANPSRGLLPVKKSVATPHTGWLEKYSTGRGFFNNWKRRSFQLHGGMLRYFIREGQADHTGLILLPNIIGLYPNPTPQEHPQATNPDRDFLVVFTDMLMVNKEFKLLLRAPTAEEKKQWIDALIV